MRALLLSLFVSTIIVLSAPFFLKNNYGVNYIDLDKMESFDLPIYLTLTRQAIYDKTLLFKRQMHSAQSTLNASQKLIPSSTQKSKDSIIRWQDTNGQWHFSNEKPFIPKKVTPPKVMDDATVLPDPKTINSIPAVKTSKNNNNQMGNDSSNSEVIKQLIPVALFIVAGFFLLVLFKTLLHYLLDRSRYKKAPEPNKPKREYTEYKAISVTTLNPYAVLGITPVSNIDEIKKAYKSLMRQYHPDKVDNLGDDLKKVALEKTAEINNAYELIKEQKGF